MQPQRAETAESRFKYTFDQIARATACIKKGHDAEGLPRTIAFGIARDALQRAIDGLNGADETRE